MHSVVDNHSRAFLQHKTLAITFLLPLVVPGQLPSNRRGLSGSCVEDSRRAYEAVHFHHALAFQKHPNSDLLIHCLALVVVFFPLDVLSICSQSTTHTVRCTDH